jgi:hypothetical protein
MDIQDLAILYRAKTDEELVRLADQTSQLTLEAQNILSIELATRRIHPAIQGNILSVQQVTAADRNSFGRGVSLPTGDFVQEVLRFYHNHIRLFVKLVFPAVAIGTLAIITTRHEAREIFRTAPRSSLLEHGPGFWAVVFLSSSGWIASWIAFSVSFGAICSAVESITTGFEGSVMDSFHAVGEGFSTLLRLAALLLVSFWTLEVVFELPTLGVFVPLSRSLFGRVNSLPIYGLTFIALSAAAWIISRFGLAIPAVVLDDVGVRQGLIRSYNLTRGRSPILAILLVKSIVGGYVAGTLPFWLAGLIPAGISLPSWFSWLLTFVSVAAVAFVEPVMFIGLALLYLKTSEPTPALVETFT